MIATAPRVCFCIDDLGIGGAQQVVRLLASHIDRCHQPLVYTFRSGPIANALEKAGVGVRVHPRRVRRLDPGLVRRLRRSLVEDDVDVLHMHLFGASLHGTLATLGIDRIATIVSIHSSQADNRLQDLAYPFILGRASAVVNVSSDAAAQIRRAYGGYGSITIPNAIDVASVEPGTRRHRVLDALSLPSGAQVVGTVGRLSPEKAHDVLLEAFVEVHHLLPAAVLVIAGEGVCRDALVARSRALGIDSFVRFLGARHDVPDLLGAMNVFALSSHREGLPLALLEAMAAGVPIVSTRVGGVTEVVRHEREALLVSPNDPGALARAIVRMLEDTALSASLARSASALVRAEYSIEAMVAQHEVLYARVRRPVPRAA